MTLAKGITCAYFPVSASVICEKIWKVLETPRPSSGRSCTASPTRAIPSAVRSASSNIDIMEREGLVENAAEVGAYLQDQLRERLGDHPYVGEVRGMGQMIAVEFVADKATRRPFDGRHRRAPPGRRQGAGARLMVRAPALHRGHPFSPPLCMTEAECDEAVEVFGPRPRRGAPRIRRLAAQT